MNEIVQKQPFRVPTGDNKIIEEHFGKASAGGEQLSLARMVAPPNWSEPFQNPEFDEYTVIFSGVIKIEVDGRTHTLNSGESILVRSGSWCATQIPSTNRPTIFRSAARLSVRKQ